MSERITFIHSGDIHLGAPFRGLRALSPKWANRLTRAIPEAYDRVIDAAIARQVDFVLLAGDIFDTDKPSYAHHRHLFAGLERLRDAGIPAYIIAGNHDPFATWAGLRETLPENVRMFGSEHFECEPFYRDGEPVAIIAARGFTNHPGAGIASGMTREAVQRAAGVQAPFCVGMLHSGLWMDPFKAPVSQDELIASGLDYWALGHIHMRYVFPETDPKLAFCGCVQGRDIRETGNRGCWCVTLEEGVPNKLEFVPTASVEWEQLKVDVSACHGTEDVLGACVRAMFDTNSQVACEEMVARITFTGVTPLHTALARPGLLEEMRTELNDRYPSFYCDALVDATCAPIDKEALRAAGMLEASLLAECDAQADDAQEGIAYVQEEFARRGLPVPADMDRRYADLCAAAENLALDCLAGRDAL